MTQGSHIISCQVIVDAPVVVERTGQQCVAQSSRSIIELALFQWMNTYTSLFVLYILWVNDSIAIHLTGTGVCSTTAANYTTTLNFRLIQLNYTLASSM